MYRAWTWPWMLTIRDLSVVHHPAGLTPDSGDGKAGRGSDGWPAAGGLSIAGEPPSQRLARLLAVFASELADLQRAVTAASSQGGSTTVSDIDLRSALYLAGILPATLHGVTIEQVMP